MNDFSQSSSLSPQSAVSEGDWIYTETYECCGKVIEKTSLWNTETFRVWLPSTDTVVRLSSGQISTPSSVLSPHHLIYVASAARVADALTQDLSACGDAQAGVLLAPIESSVIPLPHQIKALSRAISGDRVRYLLADEVGLGKTIEAGLILRELKLRGLVKRVLVIAPKGLVTQWIAEMVTHFNERFHPIMSEDYRRLKRISAIHRTEVKGLGTEWDENNSALSPQHSAPLVRIHFKFSIKLLCRWILSNLHPMRAARLRNALRTWFPRDGTW